MCVGWEGDCFWGQACEYPLQMSPALPRQAFMFFTQRTMVAYRLLYSSVGVTAH